MKKYLLLLIALILLGCNNTQEGIVCNEPYIRFEAGCCLDENSDNICDEHEFIKLYRKEFDEYYENPDIGYEEISDEFYLYETFENYSLGEGCPIGKWYQNQFDNNCDTANVFGICDYNGNVLCGLRDDLPSFINTKIGSTNKIFSVMFDMYFIDPSNSEDCGFYIGGNSASSYYGVELEAHNGEMKWMSSDGWKSMDIPVQISNGKLQKWKIVVNPITNSYDVYLDNSLILKSHSRIKVNKYTSIIPRTRKDVCYIDNICVFNGTEILPGKCGTALPVFKKSWLSFLKFW